MQKRDAVSGFTLLEIVIVLGIIGVLFGTLFAVYSSTLEISAQVDSAEERGRKVRTTLSLLESDFAGIYFGEQEENATSPRKGVRLDHRGIPGGYPLGRHRADSRRLRDDEHPRVLRKVSQGDGLAGPLRAPEPG
jgi:prepilin-type N-terminal cleavage/methylation domain-containing protein